MNRFNVISIDIENLLYTTEDGRSHSFGFGVTKGDLWGLTVEQLNKERDRLMQEFFNNKEISDTSTVELESAAKMLFDIIEE